MMEMSQINSKTEIEKKLSARYGAESFEIIKKYGTDKTYWQLEAYHAIYSTMCLNLVDFYTRRVSLMLAQQDHGLNLLNEVSTVFKKELSWTTDELEFQQMYLKNYIAKELAWKTSFQS
jgi:glycerol-3-phosphate dehydrogenase